MSEQESQYSYSIIPIDPDTQESILDPDFQLDVYWACSVPRVGEIIKLPGDRGPRRARVERVEHSVSPVHKHQSMELLGHEDEKAARVQILVEVVPLKDPSSG